MDCAPPQGQARAGQLRAAIRKFLAAALDAALEHDPAARRLPVLWVGVEIQRFGLQDTLQQKLVDASGLPFTTTSLGKTDARRSQPQFIGTYAGPASPASRAP